jgi:hypothetical protein
MLARMDKKVLFQSTKSPHLNQTLSQQQKNSCNVLLEQVEGSSDDCGLQAHRPNTQSCVICPSTAIQRIGAQCYSLYQKISKESYKDFFVFYIFR